MDVLRRYITNFISIFALNKPFLVMQVIGCTWSKTAPDHGVIRFGHIKPSTYQKCYDTLSPVSHGCHGRVDITTEVA